MRGVCYVAVDGGLRSTVAQLANVLDAVSDSCYIVVICLKNRGCKVAAQQHGSSSGIAYRLMARPDAHA